MKCIERVIDPLIRHTLDRGKSIFLFGARQTGKTTLVNRLDPQLTISFILPDVRLRYEKSPVLLKGEVEALAASPAGKLPLVVLDEVQKVPEIMDVVQDLIDRHVALFLLTGSSARKLRRHAQVNLLPGRVTVLHLDPFGIKECPDENLDERLLDGSLPGIVGVRDPEDREQDLAAYVLILKRKFGRRRQFVTWGRLPVSLNWPLRNQEGLSTCANSPPKSEWPTPR